jgi:hypothetical protein
MTHTEALDKIRKLLRLAQSSNVHEAALAASRAQEIMERFKIEALTVEYDADTKAPDEPIKDFGIDPLDAKHETWRSRLASALARENQCKVYLGRGARHLNVSLIGRPSDVSTVRYFYAYLVREIERLAARDCAGTGRTYWNNYRIGAVAEISTRLYEQRKATRAEMRAEVETQADSSRALIVLDSALAKLDARRDDVEKWAKQNLNLRSSGGGGSAYHGSAREAGRAAARSINLRPGGGRISAGFGGHLN